MFVKFETNSNVAGKGFNFSAVIHKKGKLISSDGKWVQLSVLGISGMPVIAIYRSWA